MIEVLKQAYQLLLTEPHAPTVCDQLEVIFRQAIAELESQEPVAWVDLQKEAQQIVESKILWEKFIDGTPLANDIACWMADFALQHTHPPQRTEEEPVALTDDEIYDAAFSAYCRGENTRELFRIMLNSRLTCSIGWDRDELKAFARNIEAVCTRPPQRSESSGKPSAWVGLTDDEISAIDWKSNETLHDFAKAIEAKLKEKNT